MTTHKCIFFILSTIPFICSLTDFYRYINVYYYILFIGIFRIVSFFLREIVQPEQKEKKLNNSVRNIKERPNEFRHENRIS